MKPLNDLKPILHSRRANLYYLEHCRVMVKAGRVTYLAEQKEGAAYWNIPIANTTFILLGTGTSITQAAVRMLASAGVMIGFSGGGATPLLAATEVEWLTPQSEYRPTEYLQSWLQFWFSADQRLQAAKKLQVARAAFLEHSWPKDRDLARAGFHADDMDIAAARKRFVSAAQAATTTTNLLLTEAAYAKSLYRYAAQRTGHSGFVRERASEDAANKFLDHGNYLAYGLAAVTLWALGIPHGFAVMHGKTRRGALVFDVADLVKDAIVLPLAFIAADKGLSEKDFRVSLLRSFTRHAATDFMFETIKSICAEVHP